MSRNCRGFSVIELLCMLALLATLCALVLAGDASLLARTLRSNIADEATTSILVSQAAMLHGVCGTRYCGITLPTP